jgi:hypothetical protein
MSNAMLFAQNPAKYWVQFKDKQTTAFSIDRPQEFLSPRAIEKRLRFHIPITEQDFPVSQQYIRQLLQLDSSMVLLTQSKWLNGVTVYCENEQAEALIKQLDCVAFCERTIKMKEKETPYLSWFHYMPNSYHYAQRNSAPSLLPEELAYGKSQAQIRINNAHWLHRMGYKGEGILLMIMDGGFHNVDSIRHFAELRLDNRLFGVRNFVQPDIDPMRDGSHGTYVLSCIASDVPNELIGTAPMVSVWLALTEDKRSENKIEEDNWVAGLEWADSLGCDVVNSSLGYIRFDDPDQNRSYADLTGKVSRASLAADLAASKGIIVCNSAGNEGERQWKHIGMPADADHILSVGGINIDGKRVGFSSHGYTADGRVKPDACAVATNVAVANPYGKTTLSHGTSFASPLLCGMIACLWQIFPEKTPFEIIDAIRKSGSQANKPDSLLGYGYTDFLKAYNILQCPENTYNTAGNVVMTVSPTSFVLTNKPLVIRIKSSVKTSLTVRLQGQGEESLPSKTYKLKQGENKLTLKQIPSLNNAPFGFVHLYLQGDFADYHYLLGIEPPEKKSKGNHK